jgi:glycine betaine/proline transport system permease protein
MRETILHGVQPDKRFGASFILLAIFALILVFQGLEMVPETLDRLPAHSEASAIDNTGYGEHHEVVAFDEIFNRSFDYLREDLGFSTVTRAVSRALKSVINVFNNILLGGRKGFGFDPMPWVAVAAIAFIVGFALKGWKLSLLAGGTVVFFAVFGQWKISMQTLSLLFVSVPTSIIIGILLGIMAYKKKAFENAILPVLNVAQTLPHFAYLIPVIVFFGVGHQTGVIATIIFAVPPMVRLTLLGLQKVPPELVESGKMSGCTRMQLLFRVQIPSARNEIMLGVNQVIMQCLAMVVIAAFIGAPGLGYQLLLKLQILKLGQSVEIGFAIVLLAITLDRLSMAWAEKKRDYTANLPFHVRYKYQIILVVTVTLAYIAAHYFPALEKLPKCTVTKPTDCFTISTAAFWEAIIDWVVINWYDGLLAFRSFVVIDMLVPLRNSFLFAPTIAVLVLIAGAGFILGGWYSALLTSIFFIFIALSGWWDRAMITAYMVMFAVFVCIVIGVPLGIWASRKPGRARYFLIWCDTLQTFPSFIYLLPVIMLFQVNDLSAILAVIVYAIVPAVRYTIEGIINVPPSLHEAVTMAGCSNRQRLFQLELPMAMPHILLGINQTTMFAFSMVVIAAFIGTIDLGQAIFKALSESDLGKGLTLGLCISFMALSIDHMITRWARERRKLLGLD